MGSLASSVEGRKALLSDLQSLYDQHRFQDAYRGGADYWNESTVIEDLSVEELIFAGRLASRLGGPRLSRYLFRQARETEPALPAVRYFTRHLDGLRHLLLDQLCEFERQPDLGGDDDHLRASWLAGHAYTYAVLRDFPRSAELIKQAHTLSPNDAWILSTEADVLGMADRWDESCQTAERGCTADPDSPWPLLNLATALLNLGRIREAVDRISAAAETSQFFQVVQSACWYQCALAETLEGNERREAITAARRLAERIQPLAPLADREFRAGMARTWLDIAELADDHTSMERWAREARSPFHRKVLAHLKANAGGKRIRLTYQRNIQKHVECVPTSIASALSATGVTLSVEEFAREVTFGGTAEWAAADWLREKGFHVRFFAATSDIATRLIEAGIGFVVSWDSDESGHAVAITGIDHAAGTVIAHDPGSFRTTEYLLTSFAADYSPVGVRAMAIVPQALASVLDQILPDEAAVAEAAQAHQRALTLMGPSAARPIIEDLEVRFPNHPGMLYLRAIQQLEDGRTGKALAGFRTLLEMFPRSSSVRVRLIGACRQLGDTALLRETLRSIVETGRIPGVNSQSDWASPHPRYLCDYADLLRFSSESRDRAESLLRSVLRNNWRSAIAWHVLADLRWATRADESAVLAYRIASTTAEHNEHYARAYADALARTNRLPEAIAWLRSRAQTLGTSIHAVSTWITYIDTLEDWGNPETALESCRQALSRFGDSPSLLVYAIPFLARMGEWNDAEEQLQVLSASPSRGYFHEAAVFFRQMRGQTASALEHAEAWAAEFPLSLPARRRVLDLISEVRGDNAALQRAAQWLRGRPENEDFEELFCDCSGQHRWRKLRVLLKRVQRNSDDAWGWRELVFTLIPVFEMADDSRRQRLVRRIDSYLAEADRVAPEEAATHRTHGRWQEALGSWERARSFYMESIRRDPASAYGYQRAFDVAARSSDADRRTMWAEMEPLWLANSGHLPNCLELMSLLNDAFGPRETEEIIARWQSLRPEDPNVQEALADLLLEHGHGRSDAHRALNLLRLLVQRYPYHSGLRLSLARAFRATGDDAGARQVFHDLVRRRPDNVSAWIQLAWIQDREGNKDEALDTLRQAQEQAPQSTNPVDALARMLNENRRYEEARQVIHEGLGRLPENVRMFERAIALLAQSGDDEAVVDVARQGVVVFPEGAYMWLLLGRTLHEHPEFAAPGEIEKCLRRSLQLNWGLFESADWLAVVLTDQRRYEDAMRVITAIENRLTDPSPALGRKAWIMRRAGSAKEAVTELSSTLKSYPGYSWGWNLLLSWIEEDKEWDLAKTLLGPVPPQMFSEVSFRLKRLLLLGKAKANSPSLDSEWEQLLDDFPEDIPLFLNRFDALQEAERWDEAGVTLTRIAPLAEDNVYVLARLTDIDCHQHHYEQALESALPVCFAAVEDSVWPANRVWDVLSAAGKEDELAKRFRARLDQCLRPTPRALVRYLQWIVDQERPGGFFRVLRQTRLHQVTRKVVALARLIEQSPWQSDFSFAGLFATLNQHRYPRLVVRLWRQRPAGQLDCDSAEWAEAGRAMVNLGQKRSARELFRVWRIRRGVPMWSLANYLQCLSRFRRRDLREVVVTCADALAQLPHDHCARYLTLMQAEACALMGDESGLLTLWNDRRAYFGGELRSGEYFRTELRYLLYEIPELAEALERGDRRACRKLTRRLRLQRLWSKSTRRTIRRAFAWLFRILILVWLMASISGILPR
jgi:tetratricopeptide (TPR) repeat protein